MQRRKYFLRRFRQYLLLFLLPVLVVVLISFLLSVSQITENQKQSGRELVYSVNTDLDLSLSNISQQNVQFANNPYMVLSMKRILEKGDYLTYADSINIRSINATLKSTVTTYSFVRSIFLYLNGYDNYYTSSGRILSITGQEEWYIAYQNMGDQEIEICVLPGDRTQNDEPRRLTILQKMQFFDGVVVMTVDISEYRNLLSNAVHQTGGIVVFLNMDNEELFRWGDDGSSVQVTKEDLPGAAKSGSWQVMDGHLYLIHQSDNENFRIRVVSLIPVSNILTKALGYLPSWFLMIAAGVAAALLAAYVTTTRNFGYINHIISVLGEAEKGQIAGYPAVQEVGENSTMSVEERIGSEDREQSRERNREQSRKWNRIRKISAAAGRREQGDEYDAILNNIIRLHLETERLNSELEQKKHLQEVTSLSALQAQINPHFMFNTLQMIQFKARSGENTEDVVRMTSYLSDILKYALSDPLHPITLSEEIGYLKKYVAIQHMRFGDQFILYYEVEEELLDLPVFRLMLQPIIENSILHGIRDKGEKGYIKLTVCRREDTIRFRVFDTGAGMSRERLERLRKEIGAFNVRNIGLSNVNNRLLLYYGEEAGLHIRSVEGRGTIVEFLLDREQIQKYVTISENPQP